MDLQRPIPNQEISAEWGAAVADKAREQALTGDGVARTPSGTSTAPPPLPPPVLGEVPAGRFAAWLAYVDGDYVVRVRKGRVLDAAGTALTLSASDFTDGDEWWEADAVDGEIVAEDDGEGGWALRYGAAESDAAWRIPLAAVSVSPGEHLLVTQYRTGDQTVGGGGESLLGAQWLISVDSGGYVHVGEGDVYKGDGWTYIPGSVIGSMTGVAKYVVWCDEASNPIRLVDDPSSIEPPYRVLGYIEPATSDSDAESDDPGYIVWQYLTCPLEIVPHKHWSAWCYKDSSSAWHLRILTGPVVLEGRVISYTRTAGQDAISTTGGSYLVDFPISAADHVVYVNAGTGSYYTLHIDSVPCNFYSRPAVACSLKWGNTVPNAVFSAAEGGAVSVLPREPLEIFTSGNSVCICSGYVALYARTIQFGTARISQTTLSGGVGDAVFLRLWQPTSSSGNIECACPDSSPAEVFIGDGNTPYIEDTDGRRCWNIWLADAPPELSHNLAQTSVSFGNNCDFEKSTESGAWNCNFRRGYEQPMEDGKVVEFSCVSAWDTVEVVTPGDGRADIPVPIDTVTLKLHIDHFGHIRIIEGS